jgi:hypothetical protein
VSVKKNVPQMCVNFCGSMVGLYSSPSIIRMIKSRKMKWVGYVARMGRRGMHIGYW